MDLFVNILINTIIQHYFLDSRCIIVLTDEFNYIDYTGNIPAIHVNIERASENIHIDAVFRYFGCQEVVIKSSRPLKIFKMFEREIKLRMERFNSRKYLLVSGNNMMEDLLNIFQLEELQYVSDLLVIEEIVQKVEGHNSFLPEQNIIYNLWTHRYVGKSDNNEKLLLDVWFSKNQSFMYNRSVYPNKLINQMGRNLRMTVLNYKPFSIIGPSTDEYHGSELLTSIMFAKKFNMTPIVIVEPEVGEIFDNLTGNGMLGNLITDKADLCFTGLPGWEEEYHFSDYSKPTVRSGVTCLVPAPKLAARWLTPVYSFSSEMWIAEGVMFIVCILSLFFIQYFYIKPKFSSTTYSVAQKSTAKLLDQSVFTIIRFFLSQVVPKGEIPRGFIGTYFKALLSISCLFLGSTYSSGLSAIVAVPAYENPINTVTELAMSGMNWGASLEGWEKSIDNVEETYQTIVRNFIVATEENLTEYSKTGQFAFAIERLPHENYAIGSYIKEDVIGNFHVMEEDIYWAHTIIRTRKNSILLNLLDKFILNVCEAGLISYWQDEAVNLYMDNKVQTAVKFYYYDHINNHNVEKLNWNHVQGSFGILCVGYIISLIVFLIEIFINKLKLSSSNQKIIPYTN